MRHALLICLLSSLATGVAHAQDNPQQELADAYAKLESLRTYRERITFRLEAMGIDQDEDDNADEREMDAGPGGMIAAMMAPFKTGFVRENVGKTISRMSFSIPNPSPIGSRITIELIEQGNRVATRYDDAKMRATAAAMNAAAQAAMAASNAISTARAIAGAALNPIGAIADLAGMGMQAATAAAQKAALDRANDLGKWVCHTDEPMPDQSGDAPVKLERPGTVGGKPVRRYRVLAPPGEEAFAPHIVSVDVASGLPVQVEVLDEESGRAFCVIEFYDFDAPITLEFPKCDKER